jgi:hypothetical protein
MARAGIIRHAWAGVRYAIGDAYKRKITHRRTHPERFDHPRISRRVENLAKKRSFAESMGRAIQLASVLEPIPNKRGATTRFRDVSIRRKLEYFLIGGVNIGPSFVRLANFVQQRKTPAGLYRFVYEAQLLGKEGRGGGKVNQGILEVVAPFAAALAIDPSIQDHDRLFQAAERALKETSKKDVRYLIATKIAGNMMSGKKFYVGNPRVMNVFDYYKSEEMAEETRGNETGVLHNMEYTTGFPHVRKALDVFSSSTAETFAKKTIEAYKAIRQKDMGSPTPGLACDYIAAAIFLHILLNPMAKVL